MSNYEELMRMTIGNTYSFEESDRLVKQLNRHTTTISSDARAWMKSIAEDHLRSYSNGLSHMERNKHLFKEKEYKESVKFFTDRINWSEELISKL